MVKYDRHYAASPEACGAPFAPFVERARRLPPKAKVLDLGCGQGRDALVFARLGHSVHGLDLSEVGIGQLRALAAREGLDIRAEVGDVAAFEPEAEAYDVVLLDRVLHMLTDDATRFAVLSRATRATRPGGQLLISEYPKQRALLQRFVAELEGWTRTLERGGFLFLQRA
ncbi:MAG: class I SAM-dependent methyltransferase [Alphaproteobacteria bacterium]|nr:class I SAM-dependent methyltransferase [Alphaproteobacteria bacterium]